LIDAMSGPTQSLNEHWTDILPLAQPHATSVWVLLSSAVLLLLVLCVVYLLWQYSPRQRALRTLRRCLHQLQTGAADVKQIGHTVYRTLLQGMKLTPATTPTTASAVSQDWQAFYRRLQGCVFQSSSPAQEELVLLIQQACAWLRQGRR